MIVTCSCIIKAREYADSPQTIFSCVTHFWGGGLHGWINIPTCRHPPCSKMAVSTNGDALTLIVTLSKDRQVVSRESPSFFSFQASSITLSNVPISEGLNFLLNILHKGFSNVSLISAPSIPQVSNTPYTAGGAAHVVDCCLFFVQSGYWYLLLLPIAIDCSWLWYHHAPQSVVMGSLWLELGWGASNSGNTFHCAPIACRANNGLPGNSRPDSFQQHHHCHIMSPLRLWPRTGIVLLELNGCIHVVPTCMIYFMQPSLISLVSQKVLRNLGNDQATFAAICHDLVLHTEGTLFSHGTDYSKHSLLKMVWGTIFGGDTYLRDMLLPVGVASSFFAHCDSCIQ